MRAEAIEQSLAAVAERAGDPTEQVYRRLFEMAPELRALFVRDTDASVRGQMLQQVFETVLDLVGDNHYASVLIATEWVNHQNLGVPARQFELFFDAMIDTFRDILAEQWSPAFAQAWRSVSAEVAEIVAQRGQEYQVEGWQEAMQWWTPSGDVDVLVRQHLDLPDGVPMALMYEVRDVLGVGEGQGRVDLSHGDNPKILEHHLLYAAEHYFQVTMLKQHPNSTSG